MFAVEAGLEFMPSINLGAREGSEACRRRPSRWRPVIRSWSAKPCSVRSTRPNRRADHAMSRQSRPGPNKGRTIGASAPSHAQQCRSPHTGTSDTVVRIANTGGTGAVTDSIPDPAGDRLGTKTGSTVAWLTPDLHGSIAAGLAQTAGSVTDAIRYDRYGQTVADLASGGSPATTAWKYQGRLDLSPSSIPLYAAGARDYAPGLGMFTSLDTVAGSAQDPISMNRFLYAEATRPRSWSVRTSTSSWWCDAVTWNPMTSFVASYLPDDAPRQVATAIQPAFPQAAMAIGFGDRAGELTQDTIVGAYQLYRATTDPALIPGTATELLRVTATVARDLGAAVRAACPQPPTAPRAGPATCTTSSPAGIATSGPPRRTSPLSPTPSRVAWAPHAAPSMACGPAWGSRGS